LGWKIQNKICNLKDIVFQLLLILTTRVWDGRDSGCPAKLNSSPLEVDGLVGILSNQLPDAKGRTFFATNFLADPLFYPKIKNIILLSLLPL